MGIANRETIIAANANYESDYEFAIQLNQWFLKPLGMWPLNSKKSKLEKFFSKISVVCCSGCLAFLILPGCLKIIALQELQTRLRVFGPISFCITNAVKYFFFMLRQKKIRFCLDTMCADWRDVDNQEDRTIMMINARKARHYMTICAVFMFGGGFPFSTIFPLLSKSVRTYDNVTVRDLAFPAHFVKIDPQVRPFYDFVYVLQFISCNVTCCMTCGICSITVLFVLHICGQLQVVMALLHDLVLGERKKFKTVEERLSYIVVRHLRSLRFASQLETIVNEICLAEFLGSTLNICLLGYYSITLLETHKSADFYFYLTLFTYCLLFTSYLFNIFIFCYISELLIEHCEKLGMVTYMIEWHCLPAPKARDLIHIIIISQRPAKLTAGSMVIFSIQCFCRVLKASMAYLNVLNASLS